MTLYPLEDHTAEELAKLAEFEAAAVPSEVLREQVIAAAERAIIDRQAVADTNRPLSARSYAVAAADAALAVVAAQPHPAVQRVVGGWGCETQTCDLEDGHAGYCRGVEQ